MIFPKACAEVWKVRLMRAASWGGCPYFSTKEQALENYEQAVELVPREGEQPDLLKKLEGLRREFE